MGIADFIYHLFCHAADTDDSARAFGLAHAQAAVRADFDDGVADICPVIGEFPVGEQPACSLRAAFDDMTRETSSGELIVVVRFPAEFVDARAECYGAIDAATCYDNIRTFCEEPFGPATVRNFPLSRTDTPGTPGWLGSTERSWWCGHSLTCWSSSR